MDEAYCIRPAVAGDIESVVALDGKIETVPHWMVADYLGALTPRERETRVTGTRRCLFAASSDVGIAGYAVGRVSAIEAEVLAELESVGVAESARRKGVGRALCETVMGWAREQGATQIELEVRSKSDGAIALYRGLGFATAGMRRGYYRAPEDDAILMRLKLGADSAAGAKADSPRE